MAESPSPQLVDTIPLLEECLEEICDVDYLAIGFEGRDLGARTGSLALIQVYVRDSGVVWLLDVKTMGKEVLEHEHYGVSIKSVLEDSEVRKLWFDGRNGCAALFRQFGIRLKSVFDVQILYFAWYNRNVVPTDYVTGLATIMKESTLFAYDNQLKASALRIAGRDFAEFEKRPLSEELMRYAAQDTSCLLQIYDGYKKLVRKNVAGRVFGETARRVEQAESREWDPHARGNAKVSVWW